MIKGRKAVRYHDRLGPSVLCFGILGAVGLGVSFAPCSPSLLSQGQQYKTLLPLPSPSLLSSRSSQHHLVSEHHRFSQSSHWPFHRKGAFLLHALLHALFSATPSVRSLFGRFVLMIKRWTISGPMPGSARRLPCKAARLRAGRIFFTIF